MSANQWPPLLLSSVYQRPIGPLHTVTTYTGSVKKKGDLEKYGHNYSEIHQKGKKLVCFEKFS